MTLAPTFYEFFTTYNPTLKAWEVEAYKTIDPIFGKTEKVAGPYHVPRIVTETATEVMVEQRPNGMGDMGFKARPYWKTPEAAWEAAVKENPGRKLLTLAETAEVVKARKTKAAVKRLAELRKEVAMLEKELGGKKAKKAKRLPNNRGLMNDGWTGDQVNR